MKAMLGWQAKIGGTSLDLHFLFATAQISVSKQNGI